MDKYSLVFIFGAKETAKDQVLLINKVNGLNSGKWNGLGSKLADPSSSPLHLINHYGLLSLGDCSIKQVAIIASPHTLVYCYGVYIEHDLQIIVNKLDVVNKYWIAHPYEVVRKSFKGLKEFMPDLAQLLPLAMDPNLQTSIIGKNLSQEQFSLLLTSLNKKL